MAEHDSRPGREWGDEETLPGADHPDGSHRVEDEPPDQPGAVRGPSFLLVVLLALVAIAVPVAWGIGALATVGETLGAVAMTALWVVWALVVAIFLWAVWSMWRRSA